jgi:pimeloyl-ACP methyl ester carboxylesterase
MWESQAMELADFVRVVAPDLRGHGESESVPGPYSMDLFVDDLAALLDVLEIRQKIVLCGLSMGGYVALAFYRKHAARMQALILAATRAAGDSPQAQAGRDQAAETAKEKGVEAIVQSLLPKLLAPETLTNEPELVERARSILRSTSLDGVLGDLAAMKTRPDSRPFLEDIRVPTLILHGTEDQLIPPQEAKEMQAAIPNARLQLVPQAGHLLNLEQPALFNAAVRSFISALPRGDSE